MRRASRFTLRQKARWMFAASTAVASSLLVNSSATRAAQESFSLQNNYFYLPNGSLSLGIPAFDSTLGTLTSVSISGSETLYPTVYVQNYSGTSTSFSTSVNGSSYWNVYGSGGYGGYLYSTANAGGGGYVYGYSSSSASSYGYDNFSSFYSNSSFVTSFERPGGGLSSVSVVRNGSLYASAYGNGVEATSVGGYGYASFNVTYTYAPPPASEQFITPGGGYWNNGGNWSAGTEPNSTLTDAIFSQGSAAAYPVYVTDSPQAKNLVFNNDKVTLSIGSGQQLSVGGNMFVGGTASGPGSPAQLQLINIGTLRVSSGGVDVYAGSSLTMSSSGLLATPSLYVSGGTVTENVSSGTPNIAVSSQVIVGGTTGASASPGQLSISGAARFTAGSSVTINSGGTLTQSGSTIFSTPTLNISGGSAQFSNLAVAGAGGYVNNVNLSSGNLTVPGGLTISAGGTLADSGSGILNTATLTLSGGTAQFASLNVGGSSGNVATVALNSGTLSVTNQLTVGAGGAMTASSGGYSFSAGGINVAGGTLSLASLVVGGSGANTNSLAVSGSGGSAVVNGKVTVNSGGSLSTSGSSSFSAQSMAVSGGSLTVGSTTPTVVTGSVALGQGGTLTLNSTLSLGSIAASSGSTLNWNSGGTLNFLNGYTIDTGFFLGTNVALGSGQTLANAGAAVNNGAITLSGGILSNNSSFTNSGSISGAGTIGGSGPFNNSGTISANGTTLAFAGTSPLTNSGAGTISLNGSGTLSLSGTVSNYSVVSLNGGSITGSGTLQNNSGGTVTGPGVINAAFQTNNGTLALSGGTLSVAGATDNAGVIVGQGAFSFAALTNHGTIKPAGGTLILSANGGITNASSGTVTVAAGTGLSTASAFTNNGTLNLSGGSASLASLAIVGTGSNPASVAISSGTLLVSGLTTVGAGATLSTTSGSLSSGDLTLNSGATLSFGLGQLGSSAPVSVTASGGLNFAGSTTLNLTDSGGLRVGIYPVVTYNGTYVGNLNNLTLGSSPGGFAYSIQNDSVSHAIEVVVSGSSLQSFTWNGGSGNWSNAAGWSSSNMPNTSSADVKIDNGNSTASAVNVDQNALAGRLTLDANDTLYISGQLTISGPTTSVLAGTVNNGGVLNVLSGTTQFTGGGEDTYPVYSVSSGATVDFHSGNHINVDFGRTDFTGTGGTIALTGGNYSTYALHIAAEAGATTTVAVSAGTLTASGAYVGSLGAGTGALNVSGTGMLSTGGLSIGNGTLNVTGGTVDAGALFIDTNPAAGQQSTFSGGIITLHTSSSFGAGLLLGNSPTTEGNIKITSAAHVESVGVEYIGFTGSGTVFQDGGAHISDAGTAIADRPGSTGSYTMTAGTFDAYNTGMSVGPNGTGVFNQSGTAAVEVHGDLHVGDQTGSSGTYLLSGNAILNVDGSEYIAQAYTDNSSHEYGTGFFHQSGGTHTANQLQVGQQLQGTGVYTMDGGTLNVANGLTIGPSGTFNHNSGTANLNGSLTTSGGYADLDVGGTYNLGTPTDGSANLNINHFEYIYNSPGQSAAVFHQYNGAHTVAGYLITGRYANTAGNYTIDHGTLLALNVYIAGDQNGPGGTSTFTINGGSIYVGKEAGQNVYDGDVHVWPGGTVNLNGGTLYAGSFENNGTINVYQGGTFNLVGATINSTNGGMLNFVSSPSPTALTARALAVSSSPSSPSAPIAPATFNLGTGATINGNTVNVGNGANVTAANSLALASANSTSTTVNLTGGSTSITGTLGAGNDGSLTGGGNGNAAVNLSGIASLYADTIILGNTNGGSGAMTLSGSSSVTVGGGLTTNDLTVNAGSLTVLDQGPTAAEDPELNRAIVGGYLRDGALNVNGGTVTAPNIKLGLTSGNTGTYNQSGGAVTVGILAAGNDASLSSGNGTGIINLTGGTLNANTILLGDPNGGSGSMTIGGTAAVTVGGGLTTNDLTVNNGSITVLDQNPPAGEDPELNRSIVGGYIHDGALNINGGSVSTPNLKLGITAAATGTFTQTGGTLSVTATLGVGNDATTTGGAGTGVVSISGGVTSANNLILGSNAGGIGSVDVSDGGRLVINGTLTVVNATSTLSNSGGALDITGPQNWAPGSVLNISGATAFSTDPGSNSSAFLSLNATGGQITCAGTSHFAAISFSNDAVLLDTATTGSHAVLVTGALQFAGAIDAWNGQLDLAGNDLIVHGGDLGNLTNQVKSGYSLGGFTGAGITSSAARNDSNHLTTLGVVLNNDGSGNTLYDSFDNQTVGVADLLLKYTYYGDANLDGTVNSSDYSQIDNGFNSNLTGWYDGDFNYDGVVNSSDYSLIDNAFNQTQGLSLSSGSISALIASSTALISSSSSAAVPEPTALMLLGVGAAGFMRRRRRR